MKPSAERVRALLNYNQLTGDFVWRTNAGRARPGDKAGAINSRGYRLISVDGTLYCAHRLAWLHAFGEWPESDIDHINRDRLDNRLLNLREATRSQNVANGLVRRDSQSGFRGVEKVKNKWRAYIRKDGKLYRLGNFDTPEEASAAYSAAAIVLFGEFTRQIGVDPAAGEMHSALASREKIRIALGLSPASNDGGK